MENYPFRGANVHTCDWIISSDAEFAPKFRARPRAISSREKSRSRLRSSATVHRGFNAILHELEPLLDAVIYLFSGAADLDLACFRKRHINHEMRFRQPSMEQRLYSKSAQSQNSTDPKIASFWSGE